MKKQKDKDNEAFSVVLEELRRYAEIEGSEWGETAMNLYNMWNSRSLLSEQFIATLKKEIRTWCDDVKENATIVEGEETYTVKTCELEWN